MRKVEDRAAVSGPSQDRLRILRLVKELQALAAGTDSPAESASAAAKAQSLLLRHNLTTLDVEELAARTADDPLTERIEPFAGVRARLDLWRTMLVQVVAEACLCEWMTSFHGQGGPRTFSFIGRASNVEVALYTHRCLERQFLALREVEQRRRRAVGQDVRRHLGDYCTGMVQGIRHKLHADRQVFAAASESSRAMIQRRSIEAAEHRRRLYPEIRFTKRHTRLEASARSAGEAAGRQVELRHGIGHEGRAVRYLGLGGGAG